MISVYCKLGLPLWVISVELEDTAYTRIPFLCPFNDDDYLDIPITVNEQSVHIIQEASIGLAPPNLHCKRRKNLGRSAENRVGSYSKTTV